VIYSKMFIIFICLLFIKSSSAIGTNSSSNDVIDQCELCQLAVHLVKLNNAQAFCQKIANCPIDRAPIESPCELIDKLDRSKMLSIAASDFEHSVHTIVRANANRCQQSTNNRKSFVPHARDGCGGDDEQEELHTACVECTLLLAVLRFIENSLFGSNIETALRTTLDTVCTPLQTMIPLCQNIDLFIDGIFAGLRGTLGELYQVIASFTPFSGEICSNPDILQQCC